MTTSSRYEHGAVNGMMIALIAMIVLFIGAGSLAIWAYINYDRERTTVDSQIKVAVANAQKAQSDADDKKFAEREKEPNRQFIGPDDYGRVTFMYPKTWSVYVSSDNTQGGPYSAYLNPITVLPITDPVQKFALRVTIENKSYEDVLKSYDNQLKKGDLKSAPTLSKGFSGTRVDGSFDRNFRGAAVIYKIRDKTLTIRTDADTFKPDFEQVITTISFNQ